MLRLLKIFCWSKHNKRASYRLTSWRVQFCVSPLSFHSSASLFPHSSFAKARFADALLRELAGVTILPEKIFGLGSGPKVQVLKQLQKKPEHQGLKLHFVEDRLATLKNVIKEPELDGWKLYLVANWELDQGIGGTIHRKRGRKHRFLGFRSSSFLTSVRS